VSVPRDFASNCSRPDPVVGSKPWSTNGQARPTDHLQMQIQSGGIATTTAKKRISVHVDTHWMDSDAIEIEIKREAV